MALPIAQTPILTGKSAEKFVEYMNMSEQQRSKIVMPKIDMNKFNILKKFFSTLTAKYNSTSRLICQYFFHNFSLLS